MFGLAQHFLVMLFRMCPYNNLNGLSSVAFAVEACTCLHWWCFWHIYIPFTCYYPVRMCKGKSNRFCPSVCCLSVHLSVIITKIARSWDLGVIARWKYHALRCRECRKTYLLLPSRCLRRAMNAINRVFLSAMPFNHTRLRHVLLQLHMFEFNVGEGRWFH